MESEYPLRIGDAQTGSSAPSLDSVRQKVFRAKHHFEELAYETERYFQKNPGAMVPGSDGARENPTYTFQSASQIPARFGLIAGDCVQNLRSALDYLVWELVLAAGNSPTSKNMFPVCSTRDAFKAALQRKRLEGIDSAAVATIERLQPFQLGNGFRDEVLWILDELTNINKHRRVLLTVLGSVVQPEIRATQLGGGPSGYDSAPANAENPTFLAVNVTRDVRANAKLLAFLAFNEEPVKGRLISTSLDNWIKYVGEKVMPQFDQFFS